MATDAGTTTTTHAMSGTLNRWLSPDHAIGQGLMVARMRSQLLLWRPSGADVELKRVIARLAPAYTMVDLTRLRHLAMFAARVAAEHIPGAVVECGTWRGGGLALADWVLRRAHDPRPLWGFDSFAGLPQPGARDEASVHAKFFTGWCAAGEGDVLAAVGAAGGDPHRVRLVKGWLHETLPVIETGPIALLNLDVDWYDSVMTALEALFDRIVPGGYLNIDDYGRWRGCDDAVHAFMQARGLPIALLQRSGRQGAWLRKP